MKSIKLHNQIKKMRQIRNFSPTALCERLKISRSTLYRIENGQVIPSLVIALQLAYYLEIPVDDLFSLEEKKLLTPEEKFDLMLADIIKEDSSTRASS